MAHNPVRVISSFINRLQSGDAADAGVGQHHPVSRARRIGQRAFLQKRRPWRHQDASNCYAIALQTHLFPRASVTFRGAGGSASILHGVRTGLAPTLEHMNESTTATPAVGDAMPAGIHAAPGARPIRNTET
jgi:hypothetical protein